MSGKKDKGQTATPNPKTQQNLKGPHQKIKRNKVIRI